MKSKIICIHRNLIYLRKMNGYTIERIADEIKVSRQAVSKWENGDSIPDIMNCIALAQLYDISVDDLLYYDGNDAEISIAPKGKHMFGTTILGERGQIVIPKQARDVLGLKSGDTLVVLGDENKETKGIALIPGEAFMKVAKDMLETYYPNQNKQK